MTPPPARQSKKNAKKLAKSYETEDDVKETLKSINTAVVKSGAPSTFDPNFGMAYSAEEIEKLKLKNFDWWAKAGDTSDIEALNIARAYNIKREQRSGIDVDVAKALGGESVPESEEKSVKADDGEKKEVKTVEAVQKSIEPVADKKERSIEAAA